MQSEKMDKRLWRTNGRGMDHSRVQRPLCRRPGYQPSGDSSRPPPALLRQIFEWQTWPELTVRVRNLHPTATTYELWKNFRKEGSVSLIEIFEARSGMRDGHAKVRFSPPPREPFWTRNRPSGTYLMATEDGQGRYTVYLSVEDKRRLFKIQSPIRKTVYYDEKISLFPAALTFGLLLEPNSMMSMQTVTARGREDMSFVIDLLRKRIVANFKLPFQDPRGNGDTDFVSTTPVSQLDRINRYMFTVPFDQLKTVYRLHLNESCFALLMSLESPPRFFRKREDERSTHSDGNLLWSEFDTWYRQTDIVYDPHCLQTASVSLHKEKPVIDIGRWTAYLFTFRNCQNEDAVYRMMAQALQDFNIEIITRDNLRTGPASPAELWSLIDGPKVPPEEAGLRDLEVVEDQLFLPFPVRYQLEVCISRDVLNEHNISKFFVKRLAELASEDSVKATSILEYIAEQDHRIYDPMMIFNDEKALMHSPRTEIPHYCAYSRKATVTPSRIYFSTPTVETTNRVLRNYAKEHRDGRFLRVQFTDELFEGRINSCAANPRNDELFTRIFRTLSNGIRIGDRHYKFLAFGNSQFRENGAYFFCQHEFLSCDDIRQWMGNFSHINIVAKYAARLGQCFSTTRAIHGLSKPDIVKLPDIERNGYCFTDGVGKISPFLAQMVAAELGIRSKNTPSAFQFRLGGCKGILVVSPDAKNKEVHIRKSQQKFTATYNGLEIIRWSRFSCAALNRQTITILSSLGVPDEIFIKMLSEQLSNYQTAMVDNTLALNLLSRYIDDNHMTINIASMVLNGFMSQREPFVLSLLHLWRAWSIRLLKEKAKIIVEGGAFVLGCVDELGILRGYTHPTVPRGTPFTAEELPQIFIQVPDKNQPDLYNVIEGICLVGRNPSLHPGDLRVVQAVNVPELYYLRDVVVFPQTGERDVPSMCSGGDLDGDDFFVIWDKDLQPPEWNCDSMNHNVLDPKESRRPVEVTDLMKFFVRFMKNDSLPVIAQAHLAQSDYLDQGIKDPKCLELAVLHSVAVDYVKTGQPAEMPKRLRPQKWPHFMEKKYQPKDASYHSEKILGQLYDRVDRVDFVPQYEHPFDNRILRAYKLDNSLLKTARKIKTQYDTAMRRIMAQQEIKTEFEVWSTFVLSRPRVGSDYKVQEDMSVITGGLKDTFRKVCIQNAGSKEFSVLGPFVAAMYRVTKEELDIALAECRSTKLGGGQDVPKRKMEPKYMPLISFPWLFEKELGRIATGIDASDDMNEISFLSNIKNSSHDRPRKRQTDLDIETEDYIQQEDGVIVHRGEVLDLFGPEVDLEDVAGENDSEHARSLAEGHQFILSESGELDVFDAGFTNSSFESPAQSLAISGTEVEDVILDTELDGFVDLGSRADLAQDLPVLAHDQSVPADLQICPVKSLSSTFADPALLQEDPFIQPASDAGEEIIEVEEIIEDLPAEESALQRLARLLDS